MQVAAIPPLPATIYRKNEVIIMEFANSVVNLIGNIICLGLLVTFLVGLIYREEYLRKKEKDELERKEAELRYQKMLEERR